MTKKKSLDNPPLHLIKTYASRKVSWSAINEFYRLVVAAYPEFHMTPTQLEAVWSKGLAK